MSADSRVSFPNSQEGRGTWQDWNRRTMEKFEDHSLQYCQDLQTSIISSRIYICNNIYRIMYSYICINIDIISVFKLSECSSNLTFSPHVSGLKNRRRFLSSLSTLLAKLGFRVGIKFVKF